jgi:hypothetical protein
VDSREVFLNICARWSSENLMSWLKKIVALALLALWPLAMKHCKLESMPGFAFLQCAVATAGPHDSATDCEHCCSVEKSQYRADHVPLKIPPPELVMDCSVALSPSTALPAEACVGILTAAPPSLFYSRHFVSRTALPVRAPSFVS